MTATRLLLASFVFLYVPAPAAAAVVVRSGDASISHDAAAGTWTVAAGGTTLTLALDPARDFAVVRLATSSGRAWSSATNADTFVTSSGQTMMFGSRDGGFSYVSASASSNRQGLQLDATFDLASPRLRLTRHYAVTSGSPTFETWTTYAPAGDLATISDLNGFLLNIPAGTIHYLTGLQGDNADTEHDSAFTLRQKTLAPGERLALGAQGRSSEQTVPWFAVDGAQDELYGALMWSGAWQLEIARSGSSMGASLGLAPMTTTIAATVDGPHAIFGVVRGGFAEATAALRSYILAGVRGGRPLSPLVTYNTWFAYGVQVDEASMRAEMRRASALGVELFVVDAGWYGGTGVAGPFDFDAGLGNWIPDSVRFPNGLKPLTDYAHSLGMKFGIWVEPERVNLDTVGRPGLAEEPWLATNGGHYGSDHAGQICLADAAARQWVLDRLTSLVDQAQPDYLKWDNNMWVNCDRDGHGHGASDGNFAHVNALYSVLATLRGRYPGLLIENVSGGGNRLDLGMLRYTDVAWMDDRTAPSVHVRHNLEGLSAIFPPAYLLSFVTDHDGEPLHDAPDLPLYVRSRMAGALGLCFRGDELADGDVAQMSHEIDIYKTMRSTQASAAGALLTAQAAADGGPAWDVLQESGAGASQVLLCAYQSDSGSNKVNVKPRDLQPKTTYEVRSVDSGVLGTTTGSDLMANGIDVLASPVSAAHILIVTPKQ